MTELEAVSRVGVADEGWTAVWPEFDIQIGADTLWLDAVELQARKSGWNHRGPENRE